MHAETDGADFPSCSMPADWEELRTGQTVIVTERGGPALTGTIDAITEDASILWVRLPGPAPRRLFAHTDPVVIETVCADYRNG